MTPPDHATRRRLDGLFVDITPLRFDRDYRYIWLGQAISGVGSQVTRIALPYQIFVLTGSILAVADRGRAAHRDSPVRDWRRRDRGLGRSATAAARNAGRPLR